jgi:hypothetical protein
MVRSSLVFSALLATAGASSLAADIPRHGARELRLARHGAFYTPGIRIWTSGSDLHRRGDRVRLYYRTERDAYVMIFRVDTDGRVQVLFPRGPDDDENYGSAGATYSVASYDRGSAFYVDDDPGVGYVFGVASVDPFDYRDISYNGRWDLRTISDGRIHGDPRSAMEELAQSLMPSGYGDFDTHLLPYYVDRRYDYPRFVCYDCHAHTPWAYWDPYAGWCRRYTLTVFNDPYYYYPSYWYPTWYYGGQRVVYAQPNGSRYVFKNRDNSSAPGVDYRDRRSNPGTPAGATAARTPEARGVRGADIGGVGSVSVPRSGRREAPPLAGGGGEQPRDPRTATGDAQRPPSGDAQPRRRDGGSAEGSQQPSTAAPDAGGRRRVDGQPGIQIVPRTDAPAASPSSGGRRGEPGSYGNEPRPERPVVRDGAAQPRPDAPRAAPERRPDPRPETRPEASPPPRQARPEAAPPRESRPEPKPEARQPAPKPESRPQAAPQASPPRESRPPEARQPEARQPESRPQSTPSRGSDPGLVRRRP